MKLDWLIVGGGIQGVHLAVRLLGEAGVEELRIVDPGQRLLECWRTCTATTGMTHLRSSSVHHLDICPWSLRDLGGDRRNCDPQLFAAPFDRPQLKLFNRHCDRVTEAYGLHERHIRARVEACSVDEDGVRARLSTGATVKANHMLLALGGGERVRWPHWAPQDEARVDHVFTPGFDGWPRLEETVAVIGGGTSAVQVGLRLLRGGHRVHLVSRHAPREHQFDWAPGWLGPKIMAQFTADRDMQRRRALMKAGRYVGSIAPDVHASLKQALTGERLCLHRTEIDELRAHDDHLELRLSRGKTLRVDRVLLATGFQSSRPGGAFIDDLIVSASLPVAPCGYPIVDTHLRWHPRVWVTGALAELELGLVARNIAGARRAATRIVSAVTGKAPAPHVALCSPEPAGTREVNAARRS
ncbi:MAG: FAD/NAD(P)-binding protein [Myxococcota bacterium]